jgi:hypothetical protein
MLSVGTMIQIIMKKKNLTKRDVLNRMNELDLGLGKPLLINHVYEIIDGNEKMGPIWAKRFEIALDLPKGRMMELANIKRISKGELKKIEELEQKAKIQGSN